MYWLMKTEPGTWSWQQHMAKPDRVEKWDGVRNYQAARAMKEMSLGDQVFCYHSGKERAIVGVMEVVRTVYPDPSDEKGVFVMVDVKALYPVPKPVSLQQIKAEPRLQHLALVKQSRLSVMPIDEEAWYLLCEMGGIVEGE